MSKARTYNIFLFLSTMTRGLVEVFSLVLLYKRGYSLNELLFFLFVMYSMGIVVNYFSLKIYYKLVMFMSSIIYGLSFIYLSNMNAGIIALSIFGILLSIGSYSYHVIRHYLALMMLEEGRRKTTNLVVITYLGMIMASLVGMFLIESSSVGATSIVIFILSLVGIMPILSMERIEISKRDNNERIVIPREKIIFNILEQFKVVFLELQPLFLYMYIDSSIYYVGIFSVVVNIASLVVVYFLAKKLSWSYFKYYCLILGLILVLKLNIKSGMYLMLLAFFEGIFVKIYEMFSLDNLYDYENNNIQKYLWYEELIFFGTKSIIMFLYWVLGFNFYVIMYINIVGVVLSGFFLERINRVV